MNCTNMTNVIEPQHQGVINDLVGLVGGFV